MAKLYVHGHNVAEFTKDGFATYRLMSDGKWLKSRAGGWKLAKWKAGINPFQVLAEKFFSVKVHDRPRMEELLKIATLPAQAKTS